MYIVVARFQAYFFPPKSTLLPPDDDTNLKAVAGDYWTAIDTH